MSRPSALPYGVPMSRLLGLLGTALLLTPGAACSAPTSAGDAGPTGREELEQRVLARARADEGTGRVTVSCEGGLAGEEGAVRDCRIAHGGRELGLRVTRSGQDLHLLPFLTGDQLEAVIGSGLDEPATVDCPDRLYGEVGRTAGCRLERDGRSEHLVATVTAVDGLMIDLDYEAA